MSKGLTQRLQDGECVLAAEGYLMQFEARGYLSAYGFIPEVVLEHPELVRQLHQEFVHAGSDVVLAFTYYAHREKMKALGREGDLEKINMQALRVAREVADETGTLMAGNICNTNAYNRDDPASYQHVRNIFREQVHWAVQGGADFMVGETFGMYGEAALALEVCKQVAPQLPAVITLAVHRDGLFDGVPVPDACRRLEEAGADVVGLNCSRGPATMLPLLREIRSACKGPIGALAAPYRTSEKFPTWHTLETIDGSGKPAWPLELDPWLCSRSEIKKFAEDARALGVQYLGLCCGNQAKYFRELAVGAGKTPMANRYAPNVDLHFTRINKGTDAHKGFSTAYKVV